MYHVSTNMAQGMGDYHGKIDMYGQAPGAGILQYSVDKRKKSFFLCTKHTKLGEKIIWNNADLLFTMDFGQKIIAPKTQ